MILMEDITPMLRARLPHLRGVLQAHVPMAPFSWFRAGGVAQAFYEPMDEADLAVLMAGLPPDLPVTVIGMGSNLLVRDGGIAGVVVRLGRPFQEIEKLPGGRIRAGAAAADVKVARFAADSALAGLAFLRGIPGSIGGAVAMNGGAYGGDIAQVFVSAQGIDRTGRVVRFWPDDLHFSYRYANLPPDVILTEAVLQTQTGDRDAIQLEMARISAERASTQPVNTRTGGSTFKNPAGHKAWELIDQAGCRGLRCGQVQVSPLHCNFLVAEDGATATDIEALGEEVRRRVADTSGITLEWEIRRIGVNDLARSASDFSAADPIDKD
jgi:UDP-N-acetylmuramate dehydrogenase